MSAIYTDEGLDYHFVGKTYDDNLFIYQRISSGMLATREHVLPRKQDPRLGVMCFVESGASGAYTPEYFIKEEEDDCRMFTTTTRVHPSAWLDEFIADGDLLTGAFSGAVLDDLSETRSSEILWTEEEVAQSAKDAKDSK